MAYSNFEAWLEQADMPQRDASGNWYDAEDGFHYDPDFDYINPSAGRKRLSIRALNARAAAREFGGKALTGSAKQKEWGEKIRAAQIQAMTEDQAVLACDPAGLGRSAKFWIETRQRAGGEVGAFFIEQKALLRRAKTLHAAGRAAEYAAVAAEYNALTEQWGFQ